MALEGFQRSFIALLCLATRCVKGRVDTSVIETFGPTTTQQDHEIASGLLVAGRHPQAEPSGGDVTITIDVVDTGERRTMGRYVARRVTATGYCCPPRM
jgi:hypothetical protein